MIKEIPEDIKEEIKENYKLVNRPNPQEKAMNYLFDMFVEYINPSFKNYRRGCSSIRGAVVHSFKKAIQNGEI